MPILIQNPLIVPASPQELADRVAILTLNINANHGPTNLISCHISVAPYISSTGVVLRDKIEYIRIPNLIGAASSYPSLAHALLEIYNAVEFLCKKNYFWGMQPDPISASISTQPISQSLVAGYDVTFSVDVIGNYLNYQWNKDNIALIDNEFVTGSNTNSLSINYITNSDAGNYNVYISNSISNVTSSYAALNVIPLSIPTIISQPSSISASIGFNASFHAKATGDFISYSWLKDGIFLTSSINILGVSSPDLYIMNIDNSDIGNYNLKVYNDAGFIYSSTASLYVNQ